MKPGYYSPHFSRIEMVASETAARHGIPNAPPTFEIEENLRRLCADFLEPVRERFGAIRVTSGYRCPKLNGLIGGSDTSAHMDGRAADIQPLNPAVSLRDIVEWLRTSSLPFDQVIYEYGGWVHLGIAPEVVQPRGQVLMIFKGGGYLPYNPTDPRVR